MVVRRWMNHDQLPGDGSPTCGESAVTSLNHAVKFEEQVFLNETWCTPYIARRITLGNNLRVHHYFFSSEMTSLANLTDADITLILQSLDEELNSNVLYSLLHGLYTGVCFVTLWNIYNAKSQSVMVTIIILLYIASCVVFSISWYLVSSVFIDHGQDLLSAFMRLAVGLSKSTLVMQGTAGAICTALADSTMIWRCWQVWGRRWLIILLPTILLISALVFKGIYTQLLTTMIEVNTANLLIPVLYPSFMLGTTLCCTLLIIFRILTVRRAGEGSLGPYRHVVEILVESTASYAVCLVIYVAFYARDSKPSFYADVIAANARGIAPTFLAGRVAAGHAHPDDSWDEGVISSLRFGQGHSRDDTESLDDDLESQVDRGDQLEHSLTDSKENQENVTPTDDDRGTQLSQYRG
ncbi:hypothetical protein ARMGADRAFT_1165134 [Armillaria gallica]|uniref:Uncharacterized protein n=1 Tax=Armillaria gallica TaxID=47427 RepID=A0A2H3DQF4_ARMGA|nr:hypothetical protein ARMGADRAFT_1165134 [Armillaria gallica]